MKKKLYRLLEEITLCCYPVYVIVLVLFTLFVNPFAAIVAKSECKKKGIECSYFEALAENTVLLVKSITVDEYLGYKIDLLERKLRE